MAGTRNPPWTWDELLVALDLYFRTDGNPPGKSSEAVIEASERLNALGRAVHGPALGKTYRNPNGVYMKVMNFRRLDPNYLETGRVGLKAGNRLEAEVWQSYAGRAKALARTVEAIVRATGTSAEPLEREQPEGPAFATEGQVLSALHHRRERNPKLVAEKKRQAESSGGLICEACGFDYATRYGGRGEGFMECHHLRPLSELAGPTKTKLSDLALVCANCHRMIHRQRPWLSLDELRELLR